MLPSRSVTPVPVTHDRPSQDFRLVHARVPGRTRLRATRLRGAASALEKAAQHLRTLAGVRSVRATASTGSLLVRHDPALAPEALLACLKPGAAPGAGGGAAVVREAAGRDRSPAADTRWHAEPLASLRARLDTDPVAGLDDAAVEARRRSTGPNRLTELRPRSPLATALEQFRSLPVALLGGSAVLSAATGARLDALVTVAVVLVNAAIGYGTESGTARLIARLARTDALSADVVRAGTTRRVPAEDLVTGDLLLLRRGDPVVADARVLEATMLAVDESTLTGESEPRRKRPTAMLPPETALGDRENVVHLGSTVAGGSGRALVVACGNETALGRIQTLAGSAQPPRTPIEDDLDRLGRELTVGALLVAGAAIGLGLLRGHPPVRIVTSAIALAVAAVPEGLPAVATSTLALGLRRMRRRRLLVRRLGAVEALGSVDVLCLDKTGTLTENRMRVARAVADGVHWNAGDPESSTGPLHALAETALRASELPLARDACPGARHTGTEQALFEFAGRVGVDRDVLAERFPARRLRLRDEEHNYVVAVHDGADGGWTAVKGRPAEVLALCTAMRHGSRDVRLTDALRDEVLRENERLGAEGLRVLGVAAGPGGDLPERPEGLTWRGLVALDDPVRAGVDGVVRRFHEAGVRTVMITGDQVSTAVKVAEQLGLAGDEPIQVLEAQALDRLDPELFSALAARTHVFARVSPSRKLDVVRALQRRGHVVAMTGDGVNDGPALKAADVGIAMGRDGTRVARDVADMVIEDDDLDRVLTGMAEGRTILSNIRKAVHFLVATNLSEILVVFVEVMRGPREVESPMELFWINLVTDVLPGLGLALEAPEPGVLGRPPRRRDAPLADARYYRQLLVEGMVLGSGTLAAHLWALGRYGAGPRTRAVTFYALVTAQLLHALNCRTDRFHLVGPRDLFANPALSALLGGAGALQLLPLAVPALRRLLGIAPLSLRDGAVVLAASGVTFLANEWILARRARGPCTEDPVHA